MFYDAGSSSLMSCLIPAQCVHAYVLVRVSGGLCWSTCTGCRWDLWRKSAWGAAWCTSTARCQNCIRQESWLVSLDGFFLLLMLANVPDTTYTEKYSL